MGNGNEPVYQTEDDRELANNEQQLAEEQGALKAKSSQPRDADVLAGSGSIQDGSAYGTKFVIVKHQSQKGNDYMMLYQQVGFVSKSKPGGKTDWRGEIMLDTRPNDEIEAKIIGYDKKNRTIKLSIKAKEETEEKEALETYKKDEKENISKTTLGDLLKSKFVKGKD